MAVDSPEQWVLQGVGGHQQIRASRGLHGRVWEQVQEHFPDARRVALLGDAQVLSLWPVPSAPAALEVLRLELPPGEAAKDRATLARAQDLLVDLRRDEPVLVVGGGSALDVGGFAAATVRRGLNWIALPSSVVAMCDAAIGGKVAINHPRGKNLIGAFHPARYVWLDAALLSTLPARDLRAGLAEIYKCGRIQDPELVARLSQVGADPLPALAECMRRAVQVKTQLVDQDPFDQGVRRSLNLGHTVGHALETLLGSERMRHGEGVAIGMCVAARLAVTRGLLTAPQAQRIESDLRGLGLPLDVPPQAQVAPLMEAMGLDKKRRSGAAHTWVLPLAQGVVICEDVRDEEILAALSTSAR